MRRHENGPKCHGGSGRVSCNMGYLARLLTIFFSFDAGKCPYCSRGAFIAQSPIVSVEEDLMAPMVPIRDSSVVMILRNLSKFYQQFSSRIKRNLSNYK